MEWNSQLKFVLTRVPVSVNWEESTHFWSLSCMHAVLCIAVTALGEAALPCCEKGRACTDYLITGENEE